MEKYSRWCSYFGIFWVCFFCSCLDLLVLGLFQMISTIFGRGSFLRKSEYRWFGAHFDCWVSLVCLFILVGWLATLLVGCLVCRYFANQK